VSVLLLVGSPFVGRKGGEGAGIGGGGSGCRRDKGSEILGTALGEPNMDREADRVKAFYFRFTWGRNGNFR